MHDHNGKPLAVDDIVLIPCRVKSVQANNENYCNVNLVSLYGRRPDGSLESISAINTGVLLRANPSDVPTWGRDHDPRPSALDAGQPAPVPGNDPIHPGETQQQQQERMGLMPSTQPATEVHNDENA